MQRKATKQSPAPSAAAMRHLAWVKHRELCAACGKYSQLIAHHCEGSTFRHNRAYIGPWFVIGICQDCDDIVTHGSRRAFRDIHGPQSEIWSRQFSEYNAQDECPQEIQLAIEDWGR